MAGYEPGLDLLSLNQTDDLHRIALCACVRALHPQQNGVARVPLRHDGPNVVNGRILCDRNPLPRRTVITGGALVDFVLRGLRLVVAWIVSR